MGPPPPTTLNSVVSDPSTPAAVVGVQVEAQTGKKSVVRQGEDNTALGDFCTTGGGKSNAAGVDGSETTEFSVVGGGENNNAEGNASVISGGNDNTIRPEDSDGSTISGGDGNLILDTQFSVITGGKLLRIESAEEFATISGGTDNIVFGGSGAVITGGKDHDAEGIKANVITGGLENFVGAEASVVIGGRNNQAIGDYSVALGDNALATQDSSMAINLLGGDDVVETTQAGQYLVKAKSFTFQVGVGNNARGITITASNIGNLISALN